MAHARCTATSPSGSARRARATSTPRGRRCLATTRFPPIAGRICHHPCESACNRAGYDESLSICKLERFVGDIALERGWAHAAAAAPRGERVAVVGGGPSGLSAAYQLRRRGFAVTLFESQPELGGLMRYGIPAYRLARAVLDAEIARIVAMGIDVRCGQAMDTPQALARLRAEHRRGLSGDTARGARSACRNSTTAAPGSSTAPTTWRAPAAARRRRSDARVVVIGGGSAALDVARSARRAGHEVTILALEAEARLPAQREEVVEAREEGIALVDAAMLRGVGETGAPACAWTACACASTPARSKGQFTLTPLDGTAFTLEADAIVSSIGQDPDLAPLAGAVDCDGVLLRDRRIRRHQRRGRVGRRRPDEHGALRVRGHRHGRARGAGDRAPAERTRRRRRQRRGPTRKRWSRWRRSTCTTTRRSRAPPRQRLAVPQRLAHGGEVQLGLDIEQALAEAARCFSCGTCTHCDNCVTYCPDLAVQRAGDGYTVLTDYCKGCGLCVKECPTGSMTMLEELR